VKYSVFSSFQGARLGPLGPARPGRLVPWLCIPRPALAARPACCFVSFCLQAIRLKAGDKSFRFGDVVLGKRKEKAQAFFFFFFYILSLMG
jgi:hypothetical protein